MKKLTILVDMDDVLENLVECWVNELNKKCGSSLVKRISQIGELQSSSHLLQ